MKISCIDFETANASRASACSVGVAIIQNFEIIKSEERLIRPHISCEYFHPMNISIHGIRPRDVANQPEFDQLTDWLFDVLSADLVIAHNASFDISVLRALCNLYGFKYPEFNYLCTCQLAKRFWTNLENHKLNTLCDYIGHTFTHHNAQADAQAASILLLTMLNNSPYSSPVELAEAYGIKLGSLTATSYSPCSCKKR